MFRRSNPARNGHAALQTAAAILALGMAGAVGCEGESEDSDQRTPENILTVSPETASLLRTLSPAPTPPGDPTNRYADDPEAAHLGHYLFFDTAMSPRNDLSCASCHIPGKAFTDGLPVAEAAGTGTRNTPSIINAAHYPWLNWDGSADTLWSQAARPLEADHELGSTRTTIAKLIGTDPARRQAYEQVFGALPPEQVFAELPDRAAPRPGEPDHPDAAAWDRMPESDRNLVNSLFANVCKAIAAYQQQLVAADSPFDRFASAVASGSLDRWAEMGNPGFATSELRGFELFSGEADCIACHSGPFFSDFAFHSVRVAPALGGAPTDAGRYAGLEDLFANPLNSSGAYSDDPAAPRAARLEFMANPSSNWGRFRTPPLRNVARTGPYMHAGQYPTLERVLDHYSTFRDTLPPDHHTVQERLLRPLNLSEDQKEDLLAFLHALTDISIDPSLLEPPDSPIPGSVEAKTGQ